jgi:uncharacterized protein
VYEGRLHPVEKCEKQRLVLRADADPALRPNGIVNVLVDHAANRQISDAEVDRITALYDDLLKQSWVNADEREAPMTADQILVVAPYNAQVAALKRKLPKDARVGTVDKFQGQEGAVAILSMTASDIEEVPRGFGFLFSTNRLNVAVSRARCLALIVSSPTLGTASCTTVEELKMLNFYCMLTKNAT